PLSPALLEMLREYWRWRKPKLYMFPTRTRSRTLDQPISDKTVWIACSDAARRAGIQTRHPAYVAPQLGDSLVGGRHRPAHHPGSARAWRPGNHRPVPASDHEERYMMKMIVWLWIRDIRCLVAAVHGSKKVR